MALGVGAPIPFDRTDGTVGLQIGLGPLPDLPNNFTAERRHHIPKMQFKVTNWRSTWWEESKGHCHYLARKVCCNKAD